MEHNDEIIRRKVQGLESEPVVLDRERLWSSIAFPAPRREPRSLIYYAAASVALAWALVFIMQEFSRRDQLQVRLLELELSIQSEITRVSLTSAATPAEVPCEMPATIDIVVPPKRVNIRQASVKPAVPDATIAAVREAPPSISTEKTVIEESTAATEPVLVVVQPRKPQVILGSSLPDNTSSAHGNKRLRLGLFREEERPTPGGVPLISLAGVNNQ